jgi:hypothetical protein
LDCGKIIDAKTTALSKSKSKSKIATTVLPTTTTISRKIEEAAAGLAPSWTKSLLSVPLETADIIADYILVMKSEVNLSDAYRLNVIEVLTKLSKYHNNNKNFKDMHATIFFLI